MANSGKNRLKAKAAAPKREQRLVILLSDEEMRIVDSYLRKKHVTNRSRWMRETILAHIYHRCLDQDYPTLFAEQEMRC
jgi:hypothetical protein